LPDSRNDHEELNQASDTELNENSLEAEKTSSNLSPGAPPPVEMPLPTFDQAGSDETSIVPPSDSTKVTSGEPGEPASEAASPMPPRHIYKISTAEPAWPGQNLPPLLEAGSPVGELPPTDSESDVEIPAQTVVDEGTSGWQTTWAILREVGETIILTLVIFLLIQTVIRNFRVVGTSMVNNLHDGQYLIIDKLSYNPFVQNVIGVGGPQRGDVIVFEPPGRPSEDYVKRVIGLPGEKVEIRAGQVLINDEPLPEPFQPNPGTYTMQPLIVPEGQVFVLGDNRNNSNDSHTWGSLPVENIVGRAWLSYWPPDQWGTIPRDAPTEEATLKHFVGELLVPSANAENE